MPAKSKAGPKSPFVEASGRIAKVSLDDIDGLHPAVERGRWLGAEYFLNDLSAITLAALAQVLRTHPVLLCEVVPGRKKRRRAGGGGARDESTTGAGPAASAGAATHAPEAGDIAEDSHGGANDDVDEAGSDSAAASPTPGEAIATRPRYLVVGGLRSWALAKAVNARSVPGRCGKPLRILALIVATQDDDEVVTRVRAERYLDHLLYCLKPSTASQQLAKDWKEFHTSGDAELCRLTPAFTSQKNLAEALGYTSRSAFRGRPESDPNASSKDGHVGDAENSSHPDETPVSIKDTAAGTTEYSVPRGTAPEVAHPEEDGPTSGQGDGHG